MNSTDNSTVTKKARSTSFPLIFGTLLAGFVAYYFDAGPKLMTYVMYLQERSRVSAEVKEAATAKLEKKDPNAPAESGGLPPIVDPPGYDKIIEPGVKPDLSDAPTATAPPK